MEIGNISRNTGCRNDMPAPKTANNTHNHQVSRIRALNRAMLGVVFGGEFSLKMGNGSCVYEIKLGYDDDVASLSVLQPCHPC